MQKLPASTVALITLMTPILAMIFGAVFNNEEISTRLLIGAGAVMMGLGLYHFGERLFSRRAKTVNSEN